MQHIIRPITPGRAFGSGSLDTRCKLLLAAGFGLLTWRAGPAGLALYAAGLAGVLIGLRAWRRRTIAPFRAMVMFVLVWTAVRFGLALWEGLAWPAAAVLASELGTRLALLAGIGLALSLSASARELGMAVNWFLRPVLGKNSWRPALALALMVSFLPLAWETMQTTRQAMALRQVKGWRNRALAPVQAGLRFLAGKTWEKTLAVASRGLDRPEAWRPQFDAHPLHWATTLTLLACGWTAGTW